MAEKYATYFLYVPGKEWLMTTAKVSSEDEMKQYGEDFAKAHGDRLWTELRVYLSEPEWQARRGEVEWNSSGVTPWTSRETVTDV